MSGRLVIVGGAPATGKTTLAQALGGSRQLGAAAYGVLFAVVERILSAGHGLVLESNFRRAESEPPLRALSRLAPTVVIVCRRHTHVM